MQAQQAIEACKAIRSTALPVPTKYESMCTLIDSVGAPAAATRNARPARNARAARTARTTARQRTATPATPAARTRAAAPARTRTRRATSAKALTPFQQQVYNQVPLTGGIAQTGITIPGKRANTIGTALSGLKKAGRLVEQNGVWFREMPAAQAA